MTTEELQYFLNKNNFRLRYDDYDGKKFYISGFVSRSTDYISFEDKNLNKLLERVQNVTKGNNR